jgi:hypothetical protein
MGRFKYELNHDYLEGFDRDFMVKVVGIEDAAFTEEGHDEDMKDDGWLEAHKFISYALAYKHLPWPDVQMKFEAHRTQDALFDYKEWKNWQVKNEIMTVHYSESNFIYIVQWTVVDKIYTSLEENVPPVHMAYWDSKAVRHYIVNIK